MAMDPKADKLIRRTTMVATVTAAYFLLTADYGPQENVLAPMGRRQEKKGAPNLGRYQGSTLREENIGKTKVNVSSILKIKHLQRLATWAGGEAGIGPLGALFGNCLAANAEAAGIPLDASSFTCQRCETILHPDSNCSIRIERTKNTKKLRISSQNKVVYTYHFCSHRNFMGGTGKGRVKELLTLRLGLGLDFAPEPTKSPMTPSEKRKGSGPIQSSLQKDSEASEKRKGNGRGSRKRRRKSLSSLKEIAESNEAAKTCNSFDLQCLKYKANLILMWE